MKATDIFKLIRKHIVLLILVPAILGTAVAFMTHKTYTSATTLYTGMTSGTNVQPEQSFNYYAANANFDNLMNVIQSRETSKEVALRLLAQHLMLNNYAPRYISRKSYIEFHETVPLSVRQLVVHSSGVKTPVKADTMALADTSLVSATTSVSDLNSVNMVNLQPPSINRTAYEQTVQNLEEFMSKNDTNFIYRLLDGNNPHYSIKAISSVNVQRLSNSDLIQLKYNSDDPGICQQTLVLMTEVCMKNYKKIKESRTDAVVRYFEEKVNQAAKRLNTAENNLLKYNEENKILDYKDQVSEASKTQGNLEAALQNKRIKLAGDNAAMKEIENKMSLQERLQLQNTSLLEKRNRLALLNSQIATAETAGATDSSTQNRIAELKIQAETLNQEISSEINQMYANGGPAAGVTQSTLLDSWLTSKKDYEETQASVNDLEKRIKDSQKAFEIYAPAGLALNRLEREITLAEQEYMEMLKGLNLAKLKVQDVELSSNIKAVDPPYYPLSPNPTKRLILIVFAALAGFLIVMSVILVMEYFDATLKNPQKASKILQLQPVGVFPRIAPKQNSIDFPLITNRLMEMVIQQIELYPDTKKPHHGPRTILFFSTLGNEGKSIILGNLARKLKKQGKKVIVIGFTGDAMVRTDLDIESPVTLLTPFAEPAIVEEETAPVQLQESFPEVIPENKAITLNIPETVRSSEEHLVFKVNEGYYSIKNYMELLQGNQFNSSMIPDYVLIELPPLLTHSYPAGLVASSDLSIMVCRSSRVWSQADQGALDTFMKLTRVSPLFLLNGVDLPVVKSTIGSVPRKHNGVHRKKRKAEKNNS